MDNISEDDLNKIISSINNLQVLEPILQLKQQTCKKSAFDLEFIYKNTEDVNLVVRVFHLALDIVEEPHMEIKRIIHFVLDDLKNDTLRKLNLLNGVFDYCLKKAITNVLTDCIDIADMFSIIEQVFQQDTDRKVFKVLVSQLLPRYCGLASESNKEYLLQRIFEYISVTKCLEPLCVLHRYCYFLFENNDFWLLLIECLSVKDNSYLRKQALFLLISSIDLSIEHGKYHTFTKPNLEIVDLWRKIWRDYEILVDIAREKQLHLIEPSLPLLENICVLHSAWRIVLYKIFLEHSQNTVVYHVASFILKNEHFTDLCNTFNDLLSSINKHEFSSQSELCFRNLTDFIYNLKSDNQFEILLHHSLMLSWTSVAFWCFLHSCFGDRVTFKFSFDLFEELINKIKYVQHLYIRRACLELFLQYCDRNIVFNEFQVLRIARVLRDINERVFETFLQKNLNDFPTLENLSHSEDKDFLRAYQLRSDYAPPKLLDDVTNDDDIRSLIILFSRDSSEEVLNRAIEILSSDDQKYNINQKIISLAILENDNNCEDVELIKKLIGTRCDIRNELYQQRLLGLVLKKKNPENHIDFFEEILESQSKFIDTLFENIGMVFNTRNMKLYKNVLETFVKCYKNSSCDMATVLGQIFSEKCIKVPCLQQIIINLFRKLIEDGVQDVIYILSGFFHVFLTCSLDFTQRVIAPVVELLFYGIIVQKHQRVEYWVCQQIASELPQIKSESPNEKTIKIRLNTLNFLVNLAQNDEFADNITDLLITRYMLNFNKRYFPDSLIHLEKMRILQTLLLIHEHIKINKASLISMISDSFLKESHQQSIVLLMQWMLILLLRDEDNFMDFIESKIILADKCRPSAVVSFIPVLYHLAIKNPACADKIVEILLPQTMGPNFKLRTISQIALSKLYQKGVQLEEKYNFLYKSLKTVIDSINIKEEIEFEDLLSDGSFKMTVLHEIPQRTKVCRSEWQNFAYSSANDAFYEDDPDESDQPKLHNIQKKITPWREVLEQSLCPKSDLILVASLVEKSANLGGLARTCEVFSVKHIAMKASKVADKEFQSLSMSSENWLDVLDVGEENLTDFLSAMKSKGYSLVGVEQTLDSRKLNEFQFDKNTVLVLGNEKEGIPPNIIPLMDCCIEIPQFGQTRSLNVHVAGAVVMWEYCKHLLL